MKARVKAAMRVNYDERTDVRSEYGGVLEGWILGALGRCIERGARVERGLLGWAPYNATVFTGDGVFHVHLEGEGDE